MQNFSLFFEENLFILFVKIQNFNLVPSERKTWHMLDWCIFHTVQLSITWRCSWGQERSREFLIFLILNSDLISITIKLSPRRVKSKNIGGKYLKSIFKNLLKLFYRTRRLQKNGLFSPERVTKNIIGTTAIWRASEERN